MIRSYWLIPAERSSLVMSGGLSHAMFTHLPVEGTWLCHRGKTVVCFSSVSGYWVAVSRSWAVIKTYVTKYMEQHPSWEAYTFSTSQEILFTLCIAGFYIMFAGACHLSLSYSIRWIQFISSHLLYLRFFFMSSSHLHFKSCVLFQVFPLEPYVHFYSTR